jgi:CelD/BcsL family acetyltransferase involved in cellulose biosynthesis
MYWRAVEVAVTDRLRPRNWTVKEFAASREVWDELLRTSDADPLFMSWDWQWRWWMHHAKDLCASLQLVALYSGAGQLVAIAPFYSRAVTVRRILRTCRLELIGTAWRHPAFFSDYLDIIVAREYRDAALDQIGQWLRAQKFWQELVFCCTKPDGVAAQLVRTQLAGGRYHVREVDELRGWVMRLPKQFDEYLATLGADVRRRLFNHRRKLAEPVMQEAGERDVPEYLDLLASYMAERWGRAVVGTPAWALTLDFAACMAKAGRLRLTRLVTRDGPLSVMYNVRHGGTVYYLQSGFDPVKTRGLSPGYLHFGYAIETACQEGAERFDLLAGMGRHRDYKHDLSAEQVPVATYHITRGVRRLAYALHEQVNCARARVRHFLRGI